MGLDPASWAVIGAVVASATAGGVSQYQQTQAQKHAAQRAEDSAKKQAQLAQEQAPDQASMTSSSDVVKKEEGIKGLRSQILANRNKTAPTEGNKTLLGQ